MWVPHPFLDGFQGPLVLRDLGQLRGMPLKGGEATHLSDHVPHELGVLGEVPAEVAVLRLAHVLGHLAAIVEAMAMGKHGTMAAAKSLLCSGSQQPGLRISVGKGKALNVAKRV